MSRPKPNILLQFTNTKTYKTEEVLEASAIYAIFFKDVPINLRTVHGLLNYPSKYKKCSFSNSGHAFNLAERLNLMFKCEDFHVYELTLTGGTRIYEEDPT